ncbi:hypothetical protein GCM10023107_10850 [Actinoplanes octamycinicus]|nr:hypothetical protein Aoc01nite_76780 [Actinoplanes octamycinicus]
MGLVILVGSSVGLAACSVPENGHTGLSVDAEGNPLGLVAVCSDDPPDSVYLSGSRATTGPVPVEYVPPADVGRTMSFRLDAPDNGWVARPEPSRLRPDVEYSLYGRTDDNSHSTREVDFELTDRERLSPGMVLIQEVVRGERVDAVVTQQEFEKRAQRYC